MGLSVAASIWGVAVLLYALFIAWWVNWRGPLTAREIDACLARIEAGGGDTGGADLRAFLEKDDGRQFVMLNLVRLPSEPVADPFTGERMPAPALLRRYTSRFQRVLLANGGLAYWFARKAGPYLDSWDTRPGPDPALIADPGWSAVGMMRYRSRRDMLKLASDPAFIAAHPYKIAAMPLTISFPTQPLMTLAVQPPVTVALVLALAAALVHLGISAATGQAVI